MLFNSYSSWSEKPPRIYIAMFVLSLLTLFMLILILIGGTENEKKIQSLSEQVLQLEQKSQKLSKTLESLSNEVSVICESGVFPVGQEPCGKKLELH